jgi:hypothetical protein
VTFELRRELDVRLVRIPFLWFCISSHSVPKTHENIALHNRLYSATRREREIERIDGRGVITHTHPQRPVS